MTVKLSKILASTFLCVSTFTAYQVEMGLAFQDNGSQAHASQSTLESLLRMPQTAQPAVQQVVFAESDQSSGSLQPLQPQVATPPRFRPQPLLPSLANAASSSVPVISNSGIIQPLPVTLSHQSASTTNALVQPLKPGADNTPSGFTPIVQGPLPQQRSGGPITYPSLPTRQTPTVPIVNGRVVKSPAATAAPAIAASQPVAIAPSTIRPDTIDAAINGSASSTSSAAVTNAPSPSTIATDTRKILPPVPVAASTISVPQSAVQTQAPVAQAPVAQAPVAQAPVESAPSVTSRMTTPAVAASRATTPASIGQITQEAGQTIEQAIAAAQSEISGNQIQVEEISPQELLDMIAGPSRVKAQPASTARPALTTQERVEAIGSGTTPMADSTIEMATTEQVFSGSVPSYMQAPCDIGYGCDAQRPTAPNCLPYDGCGCVSGAMGYAFVDFLYMDRDKGDFSASILPANDSYTYRPGGRIRLGRKYDSIEGWEVGFTMLDAHTANTQIISATNSLYPRLLPDGGFTLGNMSSFYGASFHESFQKSHFYSAEWNRMSYNWDVMSSFIGFRYTNMDDMYGLNTIGGGGDFGTYRLRARNHLFGPQIGGELFYDIGRRLSFSVSGKLGGYLNFHQTDFEYANANVLVVDNNDEDVDFTWSTEIGIFARYMLTPRAKLKVGYEFWYFDNVASAQGQYNGFVTPFSGLTSSNSDDALYHGASFGLEWYR